MALKLISMASIRLRWYPDDNENILLSAGKWDVIRIPNPSGYANAPWICLAGEGPNVFIGCVERALLGNNPGVVNIREEKE